VLGVSFLNKYRCCIEKINNENEHFKKQNALENKHYVFSLVVGTYKPLKPSNT
jgi:hypothetical protein